MIRDITMDADRAGGIDTDAAAEVAEAGPLALASGTPGLDAGSGGESGSGRDPVGSRSSRVGELPQPVSARGAESDGDSSGNRLLDRAAEFRQMTTEFRAQAKGEEGPRADNLEARADRMDAAADRMEAAAERSSGGSGSDDMDVDATAETDPMAAEDASDPEMDGTDAGASAAAETATAALEDPESAEQIVLEAEDAVQEGNWTEIAGPNGSTAIGLDKGESGSLTFEVTLDDPSTEYLFAATAVGLEDAEVTVVDTATGEVVATDGDLLAASAGVDADGPTGLQGGSTYEIMIDVEGRDAPNLFVIDTASFVKVEEPSGSDMTEDMLATEDPTEAMEETPIEAVEDEMA